MKSYKFQGKTKDEAINQAIEELSLEENSYFVKEQEIKQGIFKGKKIEVEIIKKEDITEFVKEYLTNLITNMGLEVNIEVKTKENSKVITLYSNNNNILIGKSGRTLDSLNVIIKQVIRNEFGVNLNFLIDVGEYKLNQQKNIERLAKKIAREVATTKVEVKLDSMNSYERRLVHNILNDHSKVYTESEGEEPNRYVVIKPRT